MAINITCTCGNRIRAQTDFAEFLCPVCGKLHTNEPSAPLTDPEPSPRFVVYGFDPPPVAAVGDLSYRLVTVAEEKPRPVAKPLDKSWPSPEPPDPRLANIYPPLEEKKLDIRRVVYVKQLEKYWPDCLGYPFQAWALLLGLGFGLTLLTGIVIGLLQLRADTVGLVVINPATWIFASMSLVAFAYTAGLFVCVLRSGAEGETPCVRWPAGDVGLAAKSLGTAALSFLAGPIVPVCVAIYFWLNAGFLQIVDHLILLELGLAALGYWLLVFISVAMNGAKGAWPHSTLRIAARLGVWGFVGPCVLFGIVLLHGPWAIVALESGHHTPAGWFLLFFCWSSLLFTLTFLFRWLGVRLYWGKQAKKAKTLQPAT